MKYKVLNVEGILKYLGNKTNNLGLFLMGHSPERALLAEQVSLWHSSSLLHVADPPRSALFRIKAEISITNSLWGVNCPEQLPCWWKAV